MNDVLFPSLEGFPREARRDSDEATMVNACVSSAFAKLLFEAQVLHGRQLAVIIALHREWGDSKDWSVWGLHGKKR